MLYQKQENTLIEFFVQAENSGCREKEDAPLFIDKEYLPQEIIDLVEAMIRGEKGHKVAL